MSDDEVALLTVLQARGQEFLKSFSDFGTKRKRNLNDADIRPARNVKPRASPGEDSELEEWTGFSSEDELESVSKESSNPNLEGSLDTCTPDVVVFNETITQAPSANNARTRAFMSSKISKLKELPAESNPKDDEDVEDELSNSHNDALLYRLVHTKLLSGSLNPELNMTSAQRRKALAGRVLELTGDSSLGKGESIVRQDEKKKASKRVRDGMATKQKDRDNTSLDEAKNLGNYHPVLKKIFAASSSTHPRKRDRGLKMGVGKFSGGMLRLTHDEISSVSDRGTRGRRGRRGGKLT